MATETNFKQNIKEHKIQKKSDANGINLDINTQKTHCKINLKQK